MTDSAREPTHRPVVGAELEHRGYTFGAKFHPSINLNKGGYNFAAAISEYMEARSVVLEPGRWVLSQPLGSNADGALQLILTPDSVQFDVVFPTHRMDWIGDRCKMVLEVFTEVFKPKLALLSFAKVAGTMPIDGDARQFLVKHVTALDPNHFSVLKRPIQAFGIRIVCPPFKKIVKKGKKSKVAEEVHWQVDVKAESLLDDPTKLYLEAEAQWPVPGDWGEHMIKEVVGHLKIAWEYLSTDVMQFLQDPAGGDER
jgi:hypothetical protein